MSESKTAYGMFNEIYDKIVEEVGDVVGAWKKEIFQCIDKASDAITPDHEREAGQAKSAKARIKQASFSSEQAEETPIPSSSSSNDQNEDSDKRVSEEEDDWF